MLWLTWATFGILVCFILFLYLRSSDKTRITDAASLAVAIASLLLAALSTHIAIKSFLAADESTKQQQAVLQSSRSALEAVVATAKQQQEILQKNLQTLQNQTAIVQMQWMNELERQSRRPKAVISVACEVCSELTSHEILVAIGPTNQTKLVYEIKNLGNASIVSPVIQIETEPSTVMIRTGFDPKPGFTPYLIRGPDQVSDIQPLTESRVVPVVTIYVTVPPGVEAFDIDFVLAAANLGSVSRKTHILVKRVKD